MKKKYIAPVVVSVLAAVATFVAQTSSAYACFQWVLDEPRMPEKLIIKD